ncbi:MULTISPECIES: cobalamin-independent methionine synthase II family protein [Kosakonia]|jgi:5-methyltetrahydropteroyltriglutamate--homocysteine methyltransferase|uniref:5-methyltetrahydropteroyltriglutamate--homocysteine S-methyltransferase n=1 Tax=Kosakonia cowanii JCM 10956 = DSM 18146 TaxID=1300165 RepID=A0A807LII6_9ENTR|nr:MULTISPECIES: cobalamin-independent methionine synthase II family protein [Kosakonia]MDP9767741.1 5-methyltetrahydropteroyltriglutamate--homocysteine methyltransferase [Atlantibacter hermannii]APZ06426.1 5-methyltetrahydropteroyltriglutamate--homocysteine S-methyltransferase [Kosakonia cowanii JCM 10956 = DSM 18146]MDM9614395.1 cobalamin-independent methionine synthase II family protein [Kosakonia cowanii]MDP4560040.1 cobalamin-independent methionine synthase II family protein [Kosakonia cow
MQRHQAPFRADVVGSFLRPDAIKQARQQFAQGEISADQLRHVENEEIRHVVEQQCACGLHVVTDGEFRRAWWHFDFFAGLEGVELFEAEQGIQFNGVQTKAHGVRVTGKVSFKDHPMLEDFRYLKSISGDAQPKMTIPSPSVLHFRGGRKVIDATVYPELDAYFDDLATTWRDAIRAFYDAGCRYLQLDDTVWAYLCSDDQRKQIVARGDDPEELARIYARVLNKALEGKPEDLTIGLHVCRGNFRSTWISEGGYEPVAEVLFGGVNVDAFFLEYDNDRSGDFAPLRFVRPGKQQVVLGLITTKNGELENPEGVKARVEEAAKYVDISQICLSPQCGFASTEEGNSLTPEQQWEKVRLVTRIAEQVW